jgi:hypothetical protein
MYVRCIAIHQPAVTVQQRIPQVRILFTFLLSPLPHSTYPCSFPVPCPLCSSVLLLRFLPSSVYLLVSPVLTLFPFTAAVPAARVPAIPAASVPAGAHGYATISILLCPCFHFKMPLFEYTLPLFVFSSHACLSPSARGRGAAAGRGRGAGRGGKKPARDVATPATAADLDADMDRSADLSLLTLLTQL